VRWRISTASGSTCHDDNGIARMDRSANWLVAIGILVIGVYVVIVIAFALGRL
jgi:hypothetical protein